jgi:hypothetical protein
LKDTEGRPVTMPPWVTNTDYCGTYNLFQGYALKVDDPGGSSGWTSDNAFCLSAVGDGWQVVLYIALAFWGFLTVVNLLAMFDLRKMGGGETVSGTVKAIAGQVATLIAVCTSFFLLLVAHRALYLLVQALAGGDLHGRVDALWDDNHAGAVSNAAQFALGHGGGIWDWIRTHIIQWIFGGDFPIDDTVGSFTWSAARSGLGAVDLIMVQGVGAIRFVVMSILVITAPLAWMAAGNQHTRPAFEFWLKEWLNLEGMAVFTAMGLAAYNHIIVCSTSTPNGSCERPAQDMLGQHLGESQYAFMLLAFTALISGPMLAYMWRIIGLILDFGVGAYKANYTRWRGFINFALDSAKVIGDAIPGPVGQVLSDAGETGRTLSNIVPGAPFTAGSNLPRDGDRGWLERRELKGDNASGEGGGGGGNMGSNSMATASNQATPQTAVNVSNSPNSAIQVNVQQLVQQAATSEATSASWGTGTAGEGAAGSSAAAGAAAGDAAEVAVVAAL